MTRRHLSETIGALMLAVLLIWIIPLIFVAIAG